MGKRILESAIERELVRRVVALGGLCEKVVVLGKRGFFDRLVIFPGARIIFVECKRPRGGVISPHQRRYHAAFAARGATVAVVRTADDINQLLDRPVICDITNQMSGSRSHKIKRGRPRTTGVGVPVIVRMHATQLRIIDRWRKGKVSRPEAIRQLVGLALKPEIQQ